MTTTGPASKRRRQDGMLMMESVTTDDEKTIEVKKRTMYVRVEKKDDYMFPTWLVIDPCSPSNSMVIASRMMESMPIHLRNINHYANAFWKSKSKMFFIGGAIWDQDPEVYLLPEEYKFSDKVFAFDVEEQTWDDDEAYPSMHSARAGSFAEVVDDKLFVFGTASRGSITEDDNHFAEYLDLSEHSYSRQWKYIPCPPKQMCEFLPLSSMAYYQPGNLFIFWVSPYGAFFTLNLSTLTWLTLDAAFPNYPQWRLHPTSIYSLYAPLHFGPFWSNRVVVMFNALFWHYGGTIYAVDFTEDDYSAHKLCTFDHPYFKSYAEGNPGGDGFPPTFLVSQAEGTLCLVWSEFVRCPPFDQYSFYFLNFTVQRQSNGTLLVHLEQPHPLEMPTTSFRDIQDVLLV